MSYPAQSGSDAALMEAVQTGESGALAELFRRHHPAIHGFLWRAGRSRSLADDLSQEVFLRVLRYRESFDGSRAFRPWLYGIARNVLASRRRREAESEPESAEALAAVADARPGPHRTFEAREKLARIEWALGHLSDEQREALVLARFHDLSYREIGEILGCSEGAVKGRVFRALRTLEKEENNP